MLKEEIGTQKQQTYIACVVLNRVLLPEYDDNVHDVVFAPNQFEPTWTGRYESATPTETTKAAVKDAIQNGDITGGAIGFQNDWLYDSSEGPPTWEGNWFELFRENYSTSDVVVFFTTKNYQNKLSQYK